jgi:hypothetical protein
MRNEWLIPLFMVTPSIAPADEVNITGETPAPPPAYNILRFDEDYSRLANPSNRCDFLDPIKYIPLRTNAPDYFLTLGGELRERFEGAHNPGFGIHGDHNDYWLQRVTSLGDLHLGERVRFFAEGISGIMEGQTGPKPPPQDDPIDLQFAFMDVIPYLTDDESLTLRAGRFGLSLGSGRLVATRASPNIPFKFDGAELLYSRPDWEATAFLTRPVNETPEGFDDSDPATAFWGLYTTHWFDAVHKLGMDFYYLGIERQHGMYASGTGYELRHSIGTRFFGTKAGFDWNAEGVFQTGTFADETILAWTASLDSGYTWDARFQPRMGLKVDVASGDTDPHGGQQETFDALYFKSGYFNDASLLRPENIIDVHPNASVNLTRTVSLDGGADVFWRYSRQDAVYAPPGFIQIPANSTASSSVGTAVDVNFEWRVQRHITLLASYVHFFTSDYVRSAGGGDVNYFSTTISIVF